MIARPFNRNWKYVLKNQNAEPGGKPTRANDRDADGSPLPGATSFELAHLPAKVEEDATHLQASGRGMDAMRLVLLYGLVGWDQLLDETGAPVQFKAGRHPHKCDPANLERLDLDARLELAAEILAGAKVSAHEGN